jgi:von Willebrand factor A domain-containing protein 8
VIALSDANFGRYGITVDDLGRALSRNAKVHTALICFGDGAEATW